MLRGLDISEKQHHIWGNPASVNIGLSPSSMENGLSDFLTRNSNSKTNVTWAKNSIVGINTQKQYVLETIEGMLNDNIPMRWYLRIIVVILLTLMVIN